MLQIKYPALLLGAMLTVSSEISQAGVYTLTTAASQGGFDGWINGYNASSTSSATLNVGNLDPRAYDRSVAVFMFDISGLAADIASEQIVSITLSYYIVNAYGSPNKTVIHTNKTDQGLAYSLDWTTGSKYGAYQTIGTYSRSSGAETVDVTSAVLGDITNGRSYASFLIYQSETWTTKTSSYPWGQTIASSENTSGYLVPTLTITTTPVPEAASAAVLAFGALALLARGRITVA